MDLGQTGLPITSAPHRDVSTSNQTSSTGSSSKKTWVSLPGLDQRVNTKLAYIPLLVSCFVSGLTDSTMYSAYGTFVSMQTGNSIFIGLGATGHDERPYGWTGPLCSMGCFIVGSVAYARLCAALGSRRRGTLMISFFIQTACVVLAAAVIQSGLINGSTLPRSPSDDVDWNELMPVALMSFQAAGQIVSSRTLGVSEIPTVVITSLLCDLMSDPKLLVPVHENVKRNKRLAAFVLTLAGAVCGGWMTKVTSSVNLALWLIAVIKLSITITWLCWGPEKGQ